MKDNENNAAKKKRFMDFCAIEEVIAELPLLARLGIIRVANIQRALKCGFPAAAKIYDLIKGKSRIKVEKNIFELDAKRQMFYLEQLINDAMFARANVPLAVYEQLYAEMKVIGRLGIVADFLFAQSIAEILREISDIPCFVGIGCCSLVAYTIGITGTELNPIDHGLIFERAFGEGKKPEMPFSFYVPEVILPEFMRRMNKIYGEELLCKHDGGLVLLSVGDTSVIVFDSIEPLQNSYMSIEESIDLSGVAVFQEDYMRIMHYVAGYDYTEADRMRRILMEKSEIQEIMNCHDDFVCKAARNISIIESECLFNEMELNMGCACCKAYALSVKTVLDACFPL